MQHMRTQSKIKHTSTECAVEVRKAHSIAGFDVIYSHTLGRDFDPVGL